VSAKDTHWDGVRLHVVTGKGGTGKTTVAAALALALAAGGKKVLLVEVEGMSYDDAAHVLGTTRAAVRGSLERARHSLGRRFAAWR